MFCSEEGVRCGGHERRRIRWQNAALAGVALTLVAGCEGIQSAMAPAGREAEEIARLYWWMVGGGTVVWLAVAGLGIYAVRTKSGSGNERKFRLMIVVGGAIVPTIVLALLLVYGLRMLPRHVAIAPEGTMRISVAGEQWWWRVRYLLPEGRSIELANEIRLPVNEPVEFLLESSNVIHSFWIPSLAGKRDMMPGRVTRLAMTPTKTGLFRGACAEYCGTSHALMSFFVRVVEKDEFSTWLEEQASLAKTPTDPIAARGQQQFIANGCGACHTIRGTPAAGVIGPDLTHVGSRISLSAGILTNHANALERWIAHPQTIKPGVQMPAFGMLPRADREAMAVYLKGLK